MRLMSVWVRPKMAPTTMDAMATAHMMGRQSHLVDEKPTYSTRRIAPNAAIFVHDAMNAVTAVGEPWYTSGVQLWNGAMPALNSNPTMSSARPMYSSTSDLVDVCAALRMAGRSTELAYPYSNASPYRKNADAKAPSRKYLTAASCDSSRRRRARPAIRYNGSDSTSRATNISSRLLAIGKISMPPTANSASGKISVCTRLLRCSSRSRGDPTTTAACATIGLPSMARSAMSMTDMIARMRIEPWMNRPTPSTAIAPPTVVSDVACRANTAISAPSRL